MSGMGKMPYLVFSDDSKFLKVETFFKSYFSCQSILKAFFFKRALSFISHST